MIPKHLKHKPIVGIDNYNQHDGHYTATGTDAESLSVGFAQYDNTNPHELTAKVFRKNKEKDRWSRQSEELPLHRCVDLCNLIVQSILKSKGIKYSDDNILKITPNDVDTEALKDIKVFYEDPKNQMQLKLRELMKLLKVLNP